MSIGDEISALVNRQIVPSVEELVNRHDRLYPVVRKRRRMRRWRCTTPGCDNEIRRQRHEGQPDYCGMCGEDGTFEEI